MTKLKALLTELSRSEIPKGPSPAFKPVHIVKALLLLEQGSMGRQSMSKMLGLGEGSARTLVKKLTEHALVYVDPVGGCNLTEWGKSIVNELRQTILSSKEFTLEEFGIQLPSFAIQVRGSSAFTIPITKLRDVAVRNGAEGMLVFNVKDSKISLPMIVDDVSKDYPKLVSMIKNSFSLENGDFIFIGFAEDRNAAELGTLAAALFCILES
ncbi:MAG: DUF4443 domain-containing protein [Candidatus Methanomethyliaceae archaeon]|nr:DUF4443 domain-containing protein [Candidatus Methanomethyliaceae archaeon]